MYRPVLLERHTYVSCFLILYHFCFLFFSCFGQNVTFTLTASWLAGVKRTILKLPRVFYSENDDCIIIWHFWHVFDTLSVYFVNITLLCSSVLNDFFIVIYFNDNESIKIISKKATLVYNLTFCGMKPWGIIWKVICRLLLHRPNSCDSVWHFDQNKKKRKTKVMK